MGVATRTRDGSTPIGEVTGRLHRVELGRRLRVAADWLPKGNSLPHAEWAIRHRWMLGLLWVHAAGLPLYGLVRGFPAAHTLLEGAGVALFAVAAAFAPVAPRWRAAVAATGLVSCSALIVHLSSGTIEAHFHFFVVILLLALYEDWVPFLIALAYVVLHHGLVGTLAPEAVYNHPDAIAHPWRWALVHGAFVAAAATGAVVAWRLNELSRAHAAEAIAQAVRSEESNELKSRFLAMTSHELRTPLTSIGGFATTLTHRWESVSDGDRRRLVEIIEAQSDRLRELIDSLLLLSALESGRIRVRASAVDVRAAVERAVGTVDGAGVVVDVPAGLQACVDEQHLTQVTVNYLTNAQKYGRPPIVVTAASRDGWLELAVSDSGDGVPRGFLSELFEPFTRADEERTGAGTGLGLSIVRGLAEANGGEAWYEPNTPRGARFKVRLPAAG